MALDKTSKNYFYNLGRTVALVEIMNGVERLVAQVNDNAKEKLPYQLREALKKQDHNLYKELIGPADVVLNQGELPSQILDPATQGNTYQVGYYHQKAYLENTYHGMYGKVETEMTVHVPERIDFSPEGVNADGKDNTIEELRK